MYCGNFQWRTYNIRMEFWTFKLKITSKWIYVLVLNCHYVPDLPKNHPSATISLYPQRFFLSCHLGINNKACSFPYIFHVVHNKLYISILHWTEVVETITRWHINFTKYHNKTVYKERLKYPKTWVSHVHKSCESSQKNIFNEVLFK